MADISSAGTQTYMVEATYDPSKMTLRKFIELYEKESSENAGRDNSTWGNQLRKNPIIKEYLDKPAINIFSNKESAKRESGNLLKDAQNSIDKGQPTLQSKIRTLEKNIFSKIEGDMQRGDQKNLINTHTRITTGVQRLGTRGAVKTATQQYTTSLIPQLIKNLQAHIIEFPDDKPLANAIIFNLETGSRGSLTTELLSEHYQPNTLSEEAKLLGHTGSDGLLIKGTTTGVKRQSKDQTKNVQPYNAPLSNRAIVILQDQSQYNEKFGESKLNNFFQMYNKKEKKILPITLAQINKLLEKVSPEGIKREIGEKGGSKPIAAPLTSSDFRKLFINVANNVLQDQTKIAALTSRDVVKNTGSTGIYIGQAGEYSDKAVNDLNAVSNRMWSMFSISNPEGRENFELNKTILSPTTFIFGSNASGETIEGKYINLSESTALDIPIQSGGKGFSVPVSVGTSNAIVDTSTSLEGARNNKELPETLKSKFAKFGIKLGFGAAVVKAITESPYQFVKDVAADVALEVGLGARRGNIVGMATYPSETNVGDTFGGDKEVRQTGRYQSGADNPSQQMGLESDPTAIDRDVAEQQVSNIAQKDTNLASSPATNDEARLPPEALKTMQQDANMINTDLDPEAGFISQADVNAKQGMGTPTSQGFMSKYGENDQDLLQTT
tara:strand:+ start:41 stop:2044 length:2004 start_codon:yes stop_codon:yes gene_type:complete